MSITNSTQSPWSKIEQPKVTSFADLMNEQLAFEMNQEELKVLQINSDIKNKEIDESLLKTQQQIIDDDYILASLLQLEFDKEYDQDLKKHEDQCNKNSKVALSFHNYKIVHPIIDEEEKRDEVPYEIESSSDTDDELLNLTFKNGIHGKGENMISKHDMILSGKRNASRVMNFPPEFETGDARTINMCLSNNVFNTLKVHSYAEEKRNNRLHDKQEKSTAEHALDSKTKTILYKLVNTGLLDSIGGIISTGKEAVVLHAYGGKSDEIDIPKECVAKVYKTTLNEFRTRSKYIKDDYRFKERYKNLNPRKIVKLWAEKEMHNLIKMRRFDILCPDVVVLKKNVLIMSFIGEDLKPAPKLKEAKLSPEQLKSAYEQCVKILKDLYRKCNLVHSDFSEYNLLWHNDKVWVIDVSQSIENLDRISLEFLYRDCQNTSKFFASKNVENVLTPEQLFNEVTEKNFTGEGDVFISQIQNYIKNKQIEVVSKDDKTYNFDYHFKESLAKKNQISIEDFDSYVDVDDDDSDYEDYGYIL